MPYRSDRDTKRSRSDSGRSSYGRAGSSRSSNRYPQFDYDLDTRRPSSRTASSRTRRRSSNRRRPYQKRSWTIGGWRFSGRTVSILICVVFVIIFLLLCKALISGRSKAKPAPESSTESISEVIPIDSSETENGESAAPEESSSEPEVPKPTNWEGLSDLDDGYIDVTQFFTYGSHLFFMGSMSPMPQVVSMQLVLRPVHELIDLASWDLSPYEEEGMTRFYSAQSITDGPCLEVIPEGQYAFLVKLTSDTGDVVYRPLRDASGNEPIEYYTITKNGKNDRIMIDTLQDPVHNLPLWGLDVQEAVLPDDVYDFVIDPGHGGNDGGCTDPDGKYTERDTVMEISQRAADMLTEKGYKVLLTRDGTEGDDRWMAFEFFDVPGGRVTISYESKAKYCISVHVNTVENPDVHGFQVFGTVRGGHQFGKMIGQSMEECTNVDPSSSTWNMQAPGVFFRTLDDLYHEGLFNNKDSLAMIREMGGIATGAQEVGTGGQSENIYRFSTQSLESDLLEIGFFSNSGDCHEMVENNATFSDALVSAYEKLMASFVPLDPSSAPAAVLSPQAQAAQMPDPAAESSEGTESTDIEPIG